MPDQPTAPTDSPTPSAPPIVTPPPAEGEKPKEAEQPKPEGDGEKLQELEKQVKTAAFEAMGRAKEVKRFREKIAQLEQQLAERDAKQKDTESFDRDFLRDPLRFLEKKLGPDYYDKISAAKLAGTVTPGMVQLDVEERVSASEKALRDEIATLRKEGEQARIEQANEKKRAYEQEAARYFQANAEKYPLGHAFGANIPAVIEHHFRETATQDGDGNWVGEVWTPEQACDALEKELEGKYQAAVKAKTPKQTEAAPAAPTQRTQTPQRRSLSTDLGGTSRADKPGLITEAERMKRAMAAIDALGAETRH